MTATWKVPEGRVVGKNDARTNLSAIISDVQSSNEGICVGGATSSTQFCAFISFEEYTNAHDRYTHGMSDCEIDVLRKSWSIKRRIVENTGQVLRLTRNGTPVAFLVPTQVAYEKNIDGARAVIEKQTREIIKDEVLRSEVALEFRKLARIVRITKRDIKEVRTTLLGLSALLPTEDELAEFRKGIALVGKVTRDWKAAQKADANSVENLRLNVLSSRGDIS